MELIRSPPQLGTASKLLFTTNGITPFSGVSKAVERLTSLSRKNIGSSHPLDPWRLHDFRRTFATGSAGLGVPLQVVEKILNHTSGTFGGIVAVYQRHDFLEKRRKAIKAWSDHLRQLSE